ncbi:unnamed protein product [Lampetra planeri]
MAQILHQVRLSQPILHQKVKCYTAQPPCSIGQDEGMTQPDQRRPEPARMCEATFHRLPLLSSATRSAEQRTIGALKAAPSDSPGSSRDPAAGATRAAWPIRRGLGSCLR